MNSVQCYDGDGEDPIAKERLDYVTELRTECITRMQHMEDAHVTEMARLHTELNDKIHILELSVRNRWFLFIAIIAIIAIIVFMSLMWYIHLYH